MEQTKKQELLKKLTKEMPDEAVKFIVWQIGRLGELGETTADEIIKGMIKPKEIWKGVVEKAREELDGKSGAVSDFKVFKWLCEELHIDGATGRADVAQYVTDILENEDGGAGDPTADSGNTAALDFESLFD